MARSAMYRRLDRFCRIVLPAELRQGLDLKGGTALEFHLDGDAIVLSRSRHGCAFCGGGTSLATYRDRHICGPCRDALRRRMARAGIALPAQTQAAVRATAYTGSAASL